MKNYKITKGGNAVIIKFFNRTIIFVTTVDHPDIRKYRVLQEPNTIIKRNAKEVINMINLINRYDHLYNIV